MAALVVGMGRALAAAHDAGVVHGDVQPWLVWVVGPDKIRLVGLEAAGPPDASSHLTDSDSVRVREAIAGDLAALGVLMNWLFTGQKPFGLEDVGEILGRLPPEGSDYLHLPAPSQLPMPPALRVIANRATDRREAYRYRSVRTLLTAVEGWLDARSGTGRGFLLEVREKLRTAGGFPISAEAVDRFSKIDQFEDERTSFLADLLLEDLAVTLELLRSINARQLRDERRAATASVLTLQRAVALFGLRGVRRVALSLKRWPGNLKPHEIAPYDRLLERCKSAARLAQSLRPPGFEAEIVYVVAVLQNLGRLVLHYHFPEQAAYVRSVLFQQGDRGGPAERSPDLDLNEESACFAVLGVDMDAITAIALQHIGLDDAARAICRRMPTNSTVHPSRKDDDLLRFTASCAIEAIDALQWPADRASLELATVMQRYGRILKVDLHAMKRLLMPHGLTGPMLRGWISRTPYAVSDPEDDLL